ncbi:TPA: sugar ABC transporter permease, partial [Pseudomonas aeruginosa]|nr:sugar ABC transporter permease [Pseudomonas aeruginosa]
TGHVLAKRSVTFTEIRMYAHTFTRGQMGLGAASAMLMLGAVLAIVVPYLYSELRGKRHA